MTIRELRERAGMSRREFAEYYQLLYQKKIIEAGSQESEKEM